MKSCQLPMTALALLGCAVCANARDLPDQKIVLACPTTSLPQIVDIDRAIQISDYRAPRNVRQRMLVLAREACANRPTAVLTFVPPNGDEPLATPIASK